MLSGCYKRLAVYLYMMCYVSVYAQDSRQNLLDSFAGKFITTIRSQEIPKAYLTTDKTVFKAGESVWFRGFLLNSASQRITNRTKYLFVDIVNEKDSVISLVLLDAAAQQLNSKINLPGNIVPGYYWVRAYTKEIAEGNRDNSFIKPIYVLSPNGRPVFKSNAKSLLGNSDTLTMKFSPEGGSIMTGANSTVAFHIQDFQGRPVVAEGYVKDNRDSIVAHFSSNKAGLGKFEFFPSSFRKYKAYLNWKGKEASYPLPSFNFHAGQIAVSKQNGGKRLLRVLLEDSVYKQDLVTYVIGVSRDSLCFASIGHGLYELSVPEKNFPGGIATFYLFDNNFKLLSERSIYIKENNLSVKASVDKNVYAKRDRVTLTVSVTDADNHPVPSLFSVSVIDSAFSNEAEECILPDFDDPCSINNIALANAECTGEEEMDLMMLVKNNTYLEASRNLSQSSIDNSDSLLYIKGKILDEKGRPAANKILTLFSNAGTTSFFTDTTDYLGQFRFPVFDYADNTQFAIEAKNLNNNSANVKIVRDPIIFPKFSTPVNLRQYLPAEPVLTSKYRNAYLDTTFIAPGGESLPPVKVSAKKEATYNQSKRVSSYSTIIASDKLDERQSVGNIVLQTGGLHMLNGFLVIGGLTALKAPDAGSEPLLLIDGVAAPSVGTVGADVSPVMAVLNSLSPNDIDFIEILKNADGANYGVRGGNGVILVNTLSSRRENFNSGNNIQTFYAKGLSQAAEFPVINYDNKAIRSSQQVDNRSTIFWNGNVFTGTNDQVNLSFFTSDIPTTYKVIINGITRRGDVIYKTLTFRNK
jgi:hypothetical protein